jgi:hypothetical protein
MWSRNAFDFQIPRYIFVPIVMSATTCNGRRGPLATSLRSYFCYYLGGAQKLFRRFRLRRIGGKYSESDLLSKILTK